MQKYVLSTIMWVESIAKKEIEMQGWTIEEVTDRLVTFSWGPEMIPRINFWSRVGNKMYMLLDEHEDITDFDSLYDMVSKIHWKKYFKKNFPIVVQSSSTRSVLESAPAIQRIGKKAIIDNITNKSGEFVKEDPELQKMEILILIIDNKARILLNTTGKALHMRGYRSEAGEAPIKESLAAALVLLSNWRFKEPFHDPFCGSGTIAIEALMIARNIAPWLRRRFAFEDLGLVQYEVCELERASARKKRYDWEYNITASDIDPKMVNLAMDNAHRAGQEWQINFIVKDFYDFVNEKSSGTIVSNPPYDMRLKDENIDTLYRNIDKLFRLNPELKGWVITGYAEFDGMIKLDNYKKRKLYNGWEKCYFYKRK